MTNLKTFLLLAVAAVTSLTASAQVEFVDLGLPSGTLWANLNVGAVNEEDTGKYFGWGETTEKDEYNWASYKWCDGTQQIMTKYVTNADHGVVDGLTVLEEADDAAATDANIGSPTVAELAELMDKNYCTWTVETVEGRKGARVTGKNGNSIFLPAGGYKQVDRNPSNNSAICLWSNEVRTTPASAYYNANCIRAGITRNGTISLDPRDHNGAGYVPRSYGYNIRPVKRVKAAADAPTIEPNATIVKIYNVNGNEVPNLVKGVNIVVYSDGSKRKVLFN